MSAKTVILRTGSAKLRRLEEKRKAIQDLLYIGNQETAASIDIASTIHSLNEEKGKLRESHRKILNKLEELEERQESIMQ